MPGAPVIAHAEGRFVSGFNETNATCTPGSQDEGKPVLERSLAKSSLSVAQTVEESPMPSPAPPGAQLDVAIDLDTPMVPGPSHTSHKSVDLDMPGEVPAPGASSSSMPAASGGREVRDKLYFRKLGLGLAQIANMIPHECILQFKFTYLHTHKTRAHLRIRMRRYCASKKASAEIVKMFGHRDGRP